MSTPAHNLDSTALDKIRDLLVSSHRWDIDMVNSNASIVALTGRATPHLLCEPIHAPIKILMVGGPKPKGTP